MVSHSDVLVVGAGPAGLALAAVLAKAGVEIRVVDAAPDGARESSRATTVHAATLHQLDLLDRAGEEIAGRAVRALGSTLWDGTRRIAQVHWDRLPGRYACMANLPQEQTEGVLRERLTATGRDIDWGVTLESLDTGGTRPVARLRGDSGEYSVAARYVVGCDGSHSVVRRALGITLEGITHEERFLLADVDLRTDLDAGQTHVFVSTRGVLGIMPMPDGSFRLNGTLADGEEATPDAIENLIIARLGRAADRVELREVRWAATYRTHSRLAERFRAGEVFLAGDAAHLVSPVGGQGMNLGIQDAVNLGWKLAQVLGDGAPPTLLDTYDAERRPVAGHALRMAERNTRLFAVRRVIERARRNTVMQVVHRLPPVQRALAWGPAGLLQAYSSAAVAGTSASKSGLRPGFQLTEPAARRQIHGAAQYRVRVPAGPLPNVFGDVAARYGLHIETGDVAGSRAPAAVLIRPDGFIGWVGDDPHDLDDHLTRVALHAAAVEPGR